MSHDDDYEEAIPGAAAALQALVSYTLERQVLARQLQDDLRQRLPPASYDELDALFSSGTFSAGATTNFRPGEEALSAWSIVSAVYGLQHDRLPPLTLCWVWDGTHSGGRPITRAGGKRGYVYRLFWSALHGPLDPFYDLDHLCLGGGRGCANPWHCQRLTPSVHRALSLLRGGTVSPASEAVIAQWASENNLNLELP